MLSGVSALLSLLVGSDKTWDEFFFVGVYPLIDGLVANGQLGMKFTPTSSDELG
jgi:hypothetical protein